MLGLRGISQQVDQEAVISAQKIIAKMLFSKPNSSN
jgi:hypothetical protein